MTDSLGHLQLQTSNLLCSVALLLLFDAAILLGAAHALAVVDDIVWVPVILDFEQPRVDVSEIPTKFDMGKKKWAGHLSKIRNFL